MHKKTLVVTRRLPHEVELRIARDHVARFNTEDRLYSSDELISTSVGGDALLTTSQYHMDAQVFSRLGGSVGVGNCQPGQADLTVNNQPAQPLPFSSHIAPKNLFLSFTPTLGSERDGDRRAVECEPDIREAIFGLAVGRPDPLAGSFFGGTLSPQEGVYAERPSSELFSNIPTLRTSGRPAMAYEYRSTKLEIVSGNRR